eukprot:SAG11_NODE_2864_length_2898_cov_1.328924_1_plen_652_part_10
MSRQPHLRLRFFCVTIWGSFTLRRCDAQCRTSNLYDLQPGQYSGECRGFIYSGMYTCEADFMYPNSFAGYCNEACEFNAYDALHGAGACDTLLGLGASCVNSWDNSTLSVQYNTNCEGLIDTYGFDFVCLDDPRWPYPGRCRQSCGTCAIYTCDDFAPEGQRPGFCDYDCEYCQRNTHALVVEAPELGTECDPTVLFQAKEMERVCCSDADAVCDGNPQDWETSLPQTCSRACANLFNPIYEACSIPQLSDLSARCIDATHPTDATEEECAFEEFLHVALACGNPDLDQFCASQCYEQIKLFEDECGSLNDRLTYQNDRLTYQELLIGEDVLTFYNFCEDDSFVCDMAAITAACANPPSCSSNWHVRSGEVELVLLFISKCNAGLYDEAVGSFSDILTAQMPVERVQTLYAGAVCDEPTSFRSESTQDQFGRHTTAITMYCGPGAMLWDFTVETTEYKIATLVVTPAGLTDVSMFTSLSDCDIVAYCTSECMTTMLGSWEACTRTPSMSAYTSRMGGMVNTCGTQIKTQQCFSIQYRMDYHVLQDRCVTNQYGRCNGDCRDVFMPWYEECGASVYGAHVQSQEYRNMQSYFQICQAEAAQAENRADFDQKMPEALINTVKIQNYAVQRAAVGAFIVRSSGINMLGAVGTRSM